ncbi:MAG: hypothetical protein H6Q00_3072 [Holophagaceae bacterium]|nr:hypothetical protein [Holophagaceae bacterium]
MLFYAFYYLVSVLLLCQGTQLLGEQRNPMGAVPVELSMPNGPSRGWGRLLVLVGLVGVVCGLVSHGEAPRVSAHALSFVQGGEWLVMAAYGFWLVFLAKRVEYQAVAAASADHGHH